MITSGPPVEPGPVRKNLFVFQILLQNQCQSSFFRDEMWFSFQGPERSWRRLWCQRRRCCRPRWGWDCQRGLIKRWKLLCSRIVDAIFIFERKFCVARSSPPTKSSKLPPPKRSFSVPVSATTRPRPCLPYTIFIFLAINLSNNIFNSVRSNDLFSASNYSYRIIPIALFLSHYSNDPRFILCNS